MTESIDDDFEIIDGRQSVIALEVQRGVCRLLKNLGLSAVTELPLAGGRRADVVGLSTTGDIWIVEIKSSLEDFRSDGKWPDYLEHCDRFYFAVPSDFPADMLPEGPGLIIADRYGGDIVLESPEDRVSGGRRKAVMLRFARAAALRLQDFLDPKPG